MSAASHPFCLFLFPITCYFHFTRLSLVLFPPSSIFLTVPIFSVPVFKLFMHHIYICIKKRMHTRPKSPGARNTHTHYHCALPLAVCEFVWRSGGCGSAVSIHHGSAAVGQSPPHLHRSRRTPSVWSRARHVPKSRFTERGEYILLYY